MTHEVAEVLAEAHRHDWALVVAATLRTARDLDLAEECVQEAYAAALTTWQRDGIPDNPAAWLTTTARRRAIDMIRRHTTWRSKLPLLIEPDEAPTPVEDSHVGGSVVDDRLRLVFLCCHPALPPEGQVALTLRLVCGVPTADIARMFLVSEPTMAARVTRAKKKIAGSRIPFRNPSAAELPERVDAALAAVYLMFTTGHTAPSGSELIRPEVVDAAIRLGRALCELLPGETEVAGLLALMLVTNARRASRISETGRLLPLAEQDRGQWDRDQLDEGDALVVAALRGAHGSPGRYTLQAAIASLHAQPDHYADTDWPQILFLYDHLLQIWPSPIVALNRAVPLSYVAGPAVALDQLTELEFDPRLEGYPYLPMVKADLFVRLDRPEQAAAHYQRARELTDNRAEQDFLIDKINKLTGST